MTPTRAPSPSRDKARRKGEDMNDREYRRERIIDEAIAAGKFGAGRRQHYRQLWDADPRGAERLVASLEPVPEVLAGEVNVPLGTGAPYPAPPFSRAEADIKPEQIEEWSNALFPEAAARKAAGPQLVERDE
jgi:hypothetical protein